MDDFLRVAMAPCTSHDGTRGKIIARFIRHPRYPYLQGTTEGVNIECTFRQETLGHGRKDRTVMEEPFVTKTNPVDI